MKQILQILFVFLAVLATAMAEERPLQPLDRPVLAGETRCPPFFAVTTFGGIAAPQVVFAYRASNGKTVSDAVPKSQVVPPRVSEGQAPTYEKTEDGRAIFRLSPTDFERVRACLPEPEAKAAP